MWKSKKFIILAAVLAVVLLFGATVGVALAQGGDNGPGPGNGVLARVAKILNIDQQKLTDAFKQARTELQAENPRVQKSPDQLLEQLVKDSKLTQSQADQLKKWWASKPANPKDNPEQFKKWMNSRPTDIPMQGPHGFFGGRRCPPGQNPPGAPAPAPKPAP